LFGVKVMAKVNKAYSLDYETILLIEKHTNNGQNSRSRLVNNAIKWYLRGDIQELVEELEFLKKIIADRKQVKESESPNPSWWRRLLLGR
jgi:hypothetical protein